MFPPRYFPPAYYAPKYFPPGGVIFNVFSAAAAIKAEHLGLLDVAAVVKKPTSSSTTAFSIIRTENLAALSTGAILRETNTALVSLDAELEEASTPFTINAVFLSPAQANFGLDAWIRSGLPYDIEDSTEIPSLDAISSLGMLEFDGTALFLDYQDTSVLVGFKGGVEHEQNITLIPGVQAQADMSDIEFESRFMSWGFRTSLDAIDTTATTTGIIDFAGGVEEVTDA